MKIDLFSDEYFMKKALEQARLGEANDEIPVGAIIVSQNQIIAKAHNQTELLTDVTAHAEIIALSSASSFLASKYLDDCTLYVTLEPCVMCAGALFWSQIGRIVYGAADEKRGFMRFGKNMIHPKTKLEFGVLLPECQNLIQSFFKKKRASKI